LGKPKQLLDWFGISFINKTIQIAKDAELSPIIVVTGAYHDLIESDIFEKGIKTVYNQNWETGQSGSIKIGVNELYKIQKKPFVVMLCDHPQIPAKLIKKMTQVYTETKCEIVSTRICGKINPPTLFSDNCYQDIMSMEGDHGAKKVIERHNCAFVDYEDERLSLDADTEENYKELIQLFSKKCA